MNSKHSLYTSKQSGIESLRQIKYYLESQKQEIVEFELPEELQDKEIMNAKLYVRDRDNAQLNITFKAKPQPANNCLQCGKPVGNDVFTFCDECFAVQPLTLCPECKGSGEAKQPGLARLYTLTAFWDGKENVLWERNATCPRCHGEGVLKEALCSQRKDLSNG